MREQRMVKVDGVDAQADIYRCDGECGKLLDPMKKPIVVAQSSFVLQYPDGFNEVVHVSNEPAGRFRYYCLPCFGAGKGCDATGDEHAKCAAALERRAADLVTVKEEALRQQKATEAAQRSRKEKPKPN